MPLESDNVEGRLSRGIIVTITLVAALLLILNVVLISCYVRRRNAARKQLHGKKPRAFVYISVCLRFFLFCFSPRFVFVFCPVLHCKRSNPRISACHCAGCDGSDHSVIVDRHTHRSMCLAAQKETGDSWAEGQDRGCLLLSRAEGRQDWPRRLSLYLRG